jgi:mannose-6-phosphate isomerase-like protein (cupin superfamily)
MNSDASLARPFTDLPSSLSTGVFNLPPEGTKSARRSEVTLVCTIVSGSCIVGIADSTVELSAGAMFTVPKGIQEATTG